MHAPDFEDFDPSWDMSGISRWLLRAADYCDGFFASHPKRKEFCAELRRGAVNIAQIHGTYVGAINALKPTVQFVPGAQERIDTLKSRYTFDRSAQVSRICRLYIDALIMARDSNRGPGRPRLRLPDYEALDGPIEPERARKIIRYAFEFEIAVKLAKEKATTGKYAGLQRVLKEAIEAGNLDDVGDTAQRIKRLARQIHQGTQLYLTPGLHAASRDALQFIYSPE